MKKTHKLTSWSYIYRLFVYHNDLITAKKKEISNFTSYIKRLLHCLSDYMHVHVSG